VSRCPSSEKKPKPTSHKSLKRKTLELELRWKRNYEEKEINEEARGGEKHKS